MNKPTKISAQVVADSLNEHGQRVTSYVLVFPRIILAELNTHRTFSRNSASSRAIPFKKMVEKCKNDPFIPIAWQKDHSGMQGTKYITDTQTLEFLNINHLEARDSAIESAQMQSELGLTKQLCNRLLEPFMWHTAIVTATEFENFFKLRCPKYRFFVDGEAKDFRSRKDALETCPDLMDAGIHSKPMDEMDWLISNQGQGEIHIMELAEQMWDAMNESIPKQLKAGEWHIPFGDKIDVFRIVQAFQDKYPAENEPEGYRTKEKFDFYVSEAKLKIATARCARVSYLNYEGTDDYEKDIKLYETLSQSGHWSPFEHCAQAMSEEEYHITYGSKAENAVGNGWCGNFRGFVQKRKTFKGESGQSTNSEIQIIPLQNENKDWCKIIKMVDRDFLVEKHYDEDDNGDPVKGIRISSLMPFGRFSITLSSPNSEEQFQALYNKMDAIQIIRIMNVSVPGGYDALLKLGEEEE